ncbi:MAG TPA: VOC family protein [Chloroflexota bacterium]|nr:VOC family protein [Chloroflexota bacterium]
MVLSQELELVVYPVTDLATAKAVFTSLMGADPYVDAPYYVGYRVGPVEVGLNPNPRGTTQPIGYWSVDDVEAALQRLVDAGAEVQQSPTNVGGGKMIATVKDADGNILGISQSPKE